MEGIVATFDLGSEGAFVAKITTGLVIIPGDTTYVRTLGTVEGGLVGGPTYTGRALYEEFKIAS